MKYFVYILWTKFFSWSIVARILLIRNLFEKRQRQEDLQNLVLSILVTKLHTILTLSRHPHVRDGAQPAAQPLSNTSNMSAQTSTNLDHHWEANTNGPKDDKNDITAFRKMLSRYTLHCLPRLSLVEHNSTLS